MEKSINPDIFKAYDIRGVYPSEINEEAAKNIGQALVQYTGAKKVVVGIDMRRSSTNLEKALIEGITRQGADVIRIGLSTTPMVYFASWKMDVDAAVVVTASHNPAQYNGFKLCKKNAVPIGEGDGMEEIKNLAIVGNFVESAERGKVNDDMDFRKKYFDYIANFFKKSGDSSTGKFIA